MSTTQTTVSGDDDLSETLQTMANRLEKRGLHKLVDVLRLRYPQVSYEIAFNDEEQPYVHIGTPDGAVNYFLEPTDDGRWEGVPVGPTEIPRVKDRTLGAASMMAAFGVVHHWSELAQSAQSLLSAA